MNLAHGGHLTARQPDQLLRHASTRSSPTACARDTELIDYDQVRDLARAAPARS